MDEIQGTLEKITYHNEENGFTVAQVKVSGRHGLVTTVGRIVSPVPGQSLDMKGNWTRHARYGEQFELVACECRLPASVHGIERYLGSGMVPGIGPEMAQRIVAAFGEKTLEIIDRHPEKLRQVPGIGAKRVRQVSEAWTGQKNIRDLMIFLQAHGVGAGLAARIYRQYGQDAVETIRADPYRLAMEITGVGFLTADRLARKIGFPMDSPARIQAGIVYVLHQFTGEGHVYCPYETLVEKSREILAVEREQVVAAFGRLTAERRLVVEDISEDLDETGVNDKAVFTPPLYLAETGVAARLRKLVTAPKSRYPTDPRAAIARVEKGLGITLAAKQAEAVLSAARQKVLVITGGPGTGKTTIINAVLRTFLPFRLKCLLAAPTGRAAKRMAETTGAEARTIHRLLEFNMQKGDFLKNSRNPLACDLLIVDESSMIDTVLMYHLLQALPDDATLILVGDVNQLPSVGAGNVLGDIIKSGLVPVIELNEIFRQARQSSIVVNAHRINLGQIPPLTIYGDKPDDFYFVPQSDPDKALTWILNLVCRDLPRRFGFDPLKDIQVMTPMHRGTVGSENLNRLLQQALNPGHKQGIVRGTNTFYPGDKVMQVRNNYDKDVFNGDIGRVVSLNPEESTMIVEFDGRPLAYDAGDLDDLVPAYAVSVHKAQGSEYPAVVMPLLNQHYMLLQRNLLYTAVTRGRKLVVIVGSRQALAMAVRNNRPQDRCTLLCRRLAGDGFRRSGDGPGPVLF